MYKWAFKFPINFISYIRTAPHYTCTTVTQHSNIKLQLIAQTHCLLASSPGHSQILSHSHGEKSGFLHGFEIKSRSGLGTRLLLTVYYLAVPFIMEFPMKLILHMHYVLSFKHHACMLQLIVQTHRL